MKTMQEIEKQIDKDIQVLIDQLKEIQDKPEFTQKDRPIDSLACHGYIKKLLVEGEKHKGTELGGILQYGAYLMSDLLELVDDFREENEALRKDCITMHEGLLQIYSISHTLHSMAFGAMPINQYSTCSQDNSSHINIMNYHEVDGYGKKGKPRPIK